MAAEALAEWLANARKQMLALDICCELCPAQHLACKCCCDAAGWVANARKQMLPWTFAVSSVLHSTLPANAAVMLQMGWPMHASKRCPWTFAVSSVLHSTWPANAAVMLQIGWPMHASKCCPWTFAVNHVLHSTLPANAAVMLQDGWSGWAGQYTCVRTAWHAGGPLG